MSSSMKNCKPGKVAPYPHTSKAEPGFDFSVHTANAPLETRARRSAPSQLRCARLPCQCRFFVEVYLYCAGLGYCFLGESNCQHAFSVIGPCALGVERLR